LSARAYSARLSGAAGDGGAAAVASGGSAASAPRVDFAFDLAYSVLGPMRLRVPYPVPFQLLGDEAKGWLDTTCVLKLV
jgi:hypothetical protein